MGTTIPDNDCLEPDIATADTYDAGWNRRTRDADGPLRACLDQPTELFYEPAPYDAQQVCADCPVRPSCARWALGFVDGRVEGFGMLGGLTETQRRRILGTTRNARRKNRAA